MRSGSPIYRSVNEHALLMAMMKEGLRLGLDRTHAALDNAIWRGPLDELHDHGLLHADAKLARLTMLGAMNLSALWCRSKSRPAQRVNLGQLPAQTVALLLHPKCTRSSFDAVARSGR